jgi:hypothetical protein
MRHGKKHLAIFKAFNPHLKYTLLVETKCDAALFGGGKETKQDAYFEAILATF